MSTTDPDAPLTTIALEPETAAGSRSRLQLALGAMLVVLVAVAGVFAFSQLRATGGGADSPDAAVEALFDALAAEDLVGVADVLLPGERRAIAQPLLAVLDELVRLDVLSTDFEASSVNGLDLEVTALDLTVDPVADDLANVYASGTIAASLNGRNLPLGDRVLGIDGMRDELDGMVEGPDEESFSQVRMTTVRDGGRWYVSLFHTLGEGARLDAGALPIHLSDALVPQGAASPEAAFEALIGAAQRLDLRGVLVLLDPDEAAALHRYTSLFLADADRAAADAPVDITVEVLDSSVERRGDRAHVIVEGYRVSIVHDDPMWGRESITVSYEDGCMRMRSESEYEDEFAYDDYWYEEQYSPYGGTIEPDGTVVVCDADVLTAPFFAGFPFADFNETSGFVFTRHGEGWYFSPVATYSEAVLAMLRHLDAQSVDELTDWWQEMMNPAIYYEESYSTSGPEGSFTYTEVTVDGGDVPASVP